VAWVWGRLGEGPRVRGRWRPRRSWCCSSARGWGRGGGLVTLGKFLETAPAAAECVCRAWTLQLLESTMQGLRRTPWVLDLDNKRNYFRAQIRQRHESHAHYGSIRISVRRAYVLEDSYNQVSTLPHTRTEYSLARRLVVLLCGLPGARCRASWCAAGDV